MTDTRAILKAVQKAQAATGQLGTAAAGEAAAGKTSTAQKADGGQAALGKAAVGQTKSAGQAPPKAMQPAVGGASSSPPAAVRQAPGAAASAAAALGPSATDHKVEAARKSKIASEEALSTAIKAATAAKKAAIAAAKRKYTGVGCRAMSCCRALQGLVLLEHAETRSCVKQWHRRTSLSVQTLLAQPVPAHNIMSQPWPGLLHSAQAAL